MTVWDSITINDMPNEDLKWVASSLGLDVAKRIWKRFAGNHVACPARMSPAVAKRYIIENGHKSVHQLALETQLSERTIYRYLNQKTVKAASGQLSLF